MTAIIINIAILIVITYMIYMLNIIRITIRSMNMRAKQEELKRRQEEDIHAIVDLAESSLKPALQVPFGRITIESNVEYSRNKPKWILPIKDK